MGRMKEANKVIMDQSIPNGIGWVEYAPHKNCHYIPFPFHQIKQAHNHIQIKKENKNKTKIFQTNSISKFHKMDYTNEYLYQTNHFKIH